MDSQETFSILGLMPQLHLFSCIPSGYISRKFPCAYTRHRGVCRGAGPSGHRVNWSPWRGSVLFWVWPLVEVCYSPLPAVLFLCNVSLKTSAKGTATYSASYSACHFPYFPAFRETLSSVLHFSFLWTLVILSFSYSSLCFNFLVSKMSMSVWSQQQE